MPGQKKITNDTTISQAQAAAAKLAADMTVLAQAYETETGTKIHSIPVERQPNGTVITRVKVQLPM